MLDGVVAEEVAMPETIKRTTGTTVAFGDVVQLSIERSKDLKLMGSSDTLGWNTWNQYLKFALGRSR